MKSYKDTESLERDLKILDLERKIALEEFKTLKHDYTESLNPVNWIPTSLRWLVTNYSTKYLVKKIFNR
ncbi:hypothetical protein Q4566_13075 [Tamlana sp. 2_MG-2023]|uniref:hypothetical protein n=1 Tax=unclassified Tamlana TaxID=2614803 RepID=UPI0026E430C6|nr:MULTISPECIES: hypothetical protein [unclassified Tamlana]MDO6761137.1 hypothetical protein [Tamlana sp. 2_MG-2023]MDO6791530.1 hypothetical protein [Tamlana sp. 1_MG-2023]